MGVDQVVVTGVTIVILMTLFVMAFDYLIPVVLKIEFDAICRNYVLVAEAQNGLSSEDITKLKGEIEALGLLFLNLNCSEINASKRGSINAFRVEGIYQNKHFISIFERDYQEIQFIFEQEFLSRKIVM